MAFRSRWLELDEAVFSRSARALIRALQGGKAFTRAELSQALMRARVPVLGEQRLGHLLMRAELDAIVCSSARRGKQFTYALLEERVPSVSSIDRGEALAKLAKTYFETRGPATVADFAWWAGLTVSDAKKGLELLGSNLEKRIVEGHAYWLAPSTSAKTGMSPQAWLLPNFDEYFVAYRDRSAGVQRLDKAGIHLNKMSALGNVVIVDGQLVGTWKRTLTKNAVVVEVNLLTNLTRAERKAVDAAANGYEEFIGLTVELSILPQ